MQLNLFPVLKNSPPKGLWHDNNGPNNQRSYATLSSSHLPGEILISYGHLPGEIQHIYMGSTQKSEVHIWQVLVNKKAFVKIWISYQIVFPVHVTVKPLWKRNILLQGCCCSALYPHCTQVEKKIFENCKAAKKI